MFDSICDSVPFAPYMSSRYRELDILKRVLLGTVYDNLPYQFHEERNGAGEYIPLRLRRPSVRYRLCKTIVDDSVSLLFSDGHFPAIDCPEQNLAAILSGIVTSIHLKEIMIDAAIRGSIGSVAILLRILQGRVFVSVLESLYLTPHWDVQIPDELDSVIERYPVSGADLISQGYKNIAAEKMYWFQRVWNREEEIWFDPEPVDDIDAVPQIDRLRTISHNLGFVPIVWIKNLPGGEGVDGACTFRAAIETNIEIDYQLSQAGRGLKYSSDPTLLIKEPASSDSEIVKGAGNALVVSEKGDAKLLEIGGTACEAVISYVRLLRELALESVHGNRASADKLSAPQSGRALELMNQGLIWLADNLRISYGDGGILPLIDMIMKASHVMPLMFGEQRIEALDRSQRISLRWPRWYPLSADDRLKDAQAIRLLTGTGHMSHELAVSVGAAAYNVADQATELARIDEELP